MLLFKEKKTHNWKFEILIEIIYGPLCLIIMPIIFPKVKEKQNDIPIRYPKNIISSAYLDRNVTCTKLSEINTIINTYGPLCFPQYLYLIFIRYHHKESNLLKFTSFSYCSLFTKKIIIFFSHFFAIFWTTNSTAIRIYII